MKLGIKFFLPVLLVFLTSGITMVTFGMIENASVAQSSKYVNYEIGEVFHDQGYIYVNPLEPTRDEDITIRVRVIRGNITKASIKYTFDLSGNQRTYYEAKMVFEQPDESGYYEYWVGIIPKQNNPFRYHFRLENNKEYIYYNASGYSLPNQELKSYNGDFLIKPGFSTPLWSQGAMWYSIMPDSFYNGDITNDKWHQGDVIQNPWGNSHFHTNDYFGGDFLGVQQQIEYLKYIGADAIQFNPFWISTHQAGYGSFDFTQIDSAFGNNDMLKQLTDALHEEEMKIVLDGVFNYFNDNGIWYNAYGNYPLPGGATSKDPFYDIFMRDDNNQVIRSWGSPEIDFSSKLARELIYSTPESVIQTYLRVFGVDGFRLDVGESLRGSDPNNWGTAEQILKDMRQYFKLYGDDKLFMSEHGRGSLLFDYTLDTKWNYDFGWPVRDWARGISNNLVLSNRLNDGINRIPRSIANSSYNFLSNHDESRIFNYVNGNVTRMNAAQLLQMTYIGAPSIYFGDEIGMFGRNNPGVGEKAPTSFDAYNWDRSTWNYDIFYYHMALAQLREELAQVYKNGAFKSLIVDEDLIAYGRWNEGGKAITIISQSDEVKKGVKIEARQLGFKNGSTIVDYLTGKTYKVKNGYITVSVMPGGAVLVEGTQAGNYRGGFEVVNLDKSKTSITREGLNAFKLSGSGSYDTSTFAHVPGFNNVDIEAKYLSGKGKSALVIRESLEDKAPFYAAEIDNLGNLVVKYRKVQNGKIEIATKHKMNANQSFKIERSTSNIFKVYVQNGTTWSELVSGRVQIEMPYEVKVGLLPISGSLTLDNVRKSQLTEQKFDDFEGFMGSMFDKHNLNTSFTNGFIQLTTTHGLGLLYTKAPMVDFSWRAKLNYTPSSASDFAGITVYQSLENGILAGLMKHEGITHVFFGKRVSGELVIVDSAPYDSDSIELQLEKIGANYQLKYRQIDDEWQTLTGLINANYSNIFAGVFVEGSTTAAVDYVTFGNAIEDNFSVGNHVHVGELPLGLDLNAVTRGVQAYHIKQGSWSYVTGGFRQSDLELELSQLLYNRAEFSNFKSEFTLKINEMQSDGFVGYRFGLSTQETSMTVGFRLELNDSGIITLYKDTDILGQYTMSNYSEGHSYRFVVLVDNGQIEVFLGENPKPIIQVKTQVSGGFMQIYGSKSDYEVISPNVFHVTPNWYVPMGNVTATNSNFVLHPRSLDNPYHYAYLAQHGVTNVFFAANVKIERLNINRGQFGLLLGSTIGRHPLYSGLFLGINDLGELIIKDQNEVLQYKLLDDINTQSFYLIVTVVDQVIKVYINNQTEPVLTYQDSIARGGAIGFYTESARVSLNYMHVEGLDVGQLYETINAYTNRQIDAPPLPNPSVSDTIVDTDIIVDLTNATALGLFNRYNGQWEVIDGILKVTSGEGNWNAGATFAAGKFKDFELKYAIKVTSGAFGGPIIRKNTFNDTHEASGLLFYSNQGNSGLTIYSSIEARPFGTILLDAEGFAHVILKVVGNQITISMGDGVTFETKTYSTSSAGRNISMDGYISLNAGNSVTLFKDISIRILDSQGNYKN